jgi:hypothetical protein
MVSLKPLLRLLLASLICGGLCGLGFGEIHDKPEATLRDLIISEAAYGSMDLVATLTSEGVSASAASGPSSRADSVPYIFNLEASRTIVTPFVIVEALLGVEIAEAKSAQGNCMRNKDPPCA